MLGYNVFDRQLVQLPSGKIVISTINAYSYVVAKSDGLFRRALLESDILLPDGFSVVWAHRILNGRRIRKIAGADIFFHLLKRANEQSQRVFFLGASQETLSLISERINAEFPQVTTDFFSPPFKNEFSDIENQIMISKVNDFKPDILFVGMTAPKQEKWVYLNAASLNTSIICSIGAVFDFYAGTVSRPSSFWIKSNLEWFVRFVKEPRRLWKRYFIYSPLFFIDVLKALLFRKSFQVGENLEE
ncbi:WecB/TagA/CpsF family glycosyltransferase [Alkaliflexus imshenetskii]|uniref:WecB/TagA/CpsF family glycosyltransferase n=1 Tax=Alkaliflexus imshenetskii TaxID=286730 RepID=UPI0004BC8F86|nr:WecB/TagA/CpsF family glycosyltransferase [Alkaliflexus imshenetskii]